MDIKPYLIGTYTDSPGRDIPSTHQGDVGLDLFYNLTPQLKANFTLNTDFAQTEVDDRQVNLTRFRLFFPEKRDFFLEGAGNFDFSRDPARNLSAFFSRRIGLTADGQPQKIDYGGKLTGRAGDFDLGFLQVRTAGDGVVRGEDFTVLRTKRNFFSESYAGLIYTRRATRESSLADRHTIGADIQIATSRFRGSQNLRFAGYYMKTPNDAKVGDDSIYGLRVDYPNDLWVGNVFYRVIQRNADPGCRFCGRKRLPETNPAPSVPPPSQEQPLDPPGCHGSAARGFLYRRYQWQMGRTQLPLHVDGSQFSFG